ncbi:MAG: peptide ABC transporter permease [Deltaproteobacteria bacterium CG11_big_fil_rev_8_21_14_0_20_47_16]|nr:MAG: peptide ABC transporter permease [Deltaproteobacteria bacterium CG11_big_fil_rev_8_21_14_0_20_47_16]
MVWRQYRRNHLATWGLVFIAFLIVMALGAPWIATNKPLWCNASGSYCLKAPIPYTPTQYNLDESLMPPNRHHWLGTDEQGRDVAARMVFGSRISLAVGVVAVGIYVAIGILLGALAGYYGGWVDQVVSRAIEIMICFPTFFLILTLLAFLGPSIYNIMIIIGLTSWTGIARLVRGEFLKLKNQDFVQAAIALGASDSRVIFRHMLPNALAPVLVSATFGVAAAILIESGLSFLGFGVPPHIPSWGSILSQSQEFMDIAWWLTLVPGAAIFITITVYNIVGEGLRDAIDPRLKV